MKSYILYNPLAGNGVNSEKLAEIKKLVGCESVELDVTKILGYDELLSALSEDDKLVICGGDGTLNRFINAIDTDNITNKIFYYAAGSGNDFLNDVGAQNNSPLLEINKYLKNLPTVTVKGKSYKYLNGVGFGIDGYCCQEGDRLKAESDKPVDYTAIAIKGLLFYFKPVNATVTIDGKTREFKKVWIAPTMNGRCYGGGMIPTPKQNRLGDGRQSCMIFHGSGKLKTLMVFPSIFKGEHVKHSRIVDIFEGREITVTFDRPCALQIDGETILDVTSYSVKATKRR